MNAHALLTSQGWRGKGHSLHPTSDSTGLSRPILVSRKQNNLGVGKKQHKTSDMWWMNAFDKSLQGLDTSKEGIVVQTISNGGLDMAVKGGSKFVGNGGLYASFVKGESLKGTITPEETNETLSSEGQDTRQRSSKQSKEERRAAKAARRAERAKKEAENNENCSLAAEQKEETKAKTAKTSRKATSEPSKEERRERKSRKRLLRQEEKHENEIHTENPKKKRRKD
ncbi:hypothetical protein F5884DRAFT_820884 [Xylogone sp. PMI_703]|nr:hypothetical protein F5884DRAFT_820884 [Xylogone sp. PMI_703]